jgi:transcription antitermination protein NusB
MSRGPSPRHAAARQARSSARLAAVQALYQMDVAGTGIEAVIEEFVRDRFAAPRIAAEDEIPAHEPEAGEAAIVGADATFFTSLIRGTVRCQRDVDPVIDRSLAEGWRLVRIDSLVRAIFRAAVFELMERPDVPARVVINEYIEVSRAFFDGDEPRLVNGVLDRLARQFRAPEFEPKMPPENGSDR